MSQPDEGLEFWRRPCTQGKIYRDISSSDLSDFDLDDDTKACSSSSACVSSSNCSSACVSSSNCSSACVSSSNCSPASQTFKSLDEVPKSIREKYFSDYSEICSENSLLGYDSDTRHIRVAFLDKDGSSEFRWIPVDVLMRDAKRHNDEFLKELKLYISKQDESYSENPANYIHEAMRSEGWYEPRASVILFEKLTEKHPFISLTIPNSPEHKEDPKVFLNFSDKSFNNGINYTTLKCILDGLCGLKKMDKYYAKISRELARFVYYYIHMLCFIASTSESDAVTSVKSVKKYMGYEIIVNDLSNGMLSRKEEEEMSHDDAKKWLESIDFNFIRDMVRPLALKVLHKRPHDATILAWYQLNEMPISPMELTKTWTEKMSRLQAITNKASSINRKFSLPKSKRARSIGAADLSDAVELSGVTKLSEAADLSGAAKLSGAAMSIESQQRAPNKKKAKSIATAESKQKKEKEAECIESYNVTFNRGIKLLIDAAERMEKAEHEMPLDIEEFESPQTQVMECRSGRAFRKSPKLISYAKSLLAKNSDEEVDDE